MSLEAVIRRAQANPKNVDCLDGLSDDDLILFLSEIAYYVPKACVLWTPRVSWAMRVLNQRRWTALILLYDEGYFTRMKGPKSPIMRFYEIAIRLPFEVQTRLIVALAAPLPKLAQRASDWLFLAEINSDVLLTSSPPTRRYLAILRALNDDTGLLVLSITRQLARPASTSSIRLRKADWCWALREQGPRE